MLSPGDGAAMAGVSIMVATLLAKMLPKRNGITRAEVERKLDGKQDNEMCKVLHNQVAQEINGVKEGQNRIWKKVDEVHVAIIEMAKKK